MGAFGAIWKFGSVKMWKWKKSKIALSKRAEGATFAHFHFFTLANFSLAHLHIAPKAPHFPILPLIFVEKRFII